MKPPLTPTAIFFTGLALLFGGCAGKLGTFSGWGASTTLSEGGVPVFTTSGNHVGLHYHKTATETELTEGLLTHDKATNAQWAGLNHNIDALGNTATKAGDAWVKAKGGSIPSIPSITSKP